MKKNIKLRNIALLLTLITIIIVSFLFCKSSVSRVFALAGYIGLTLTYLSIVLNKKSLLITGIIILVSVLLGVNYFYNIFNIDDFVGFQSDSECYVTDVIQYDENVLAINRFGLGYFGGDDFYAYKSQIGFQGKMFYLVYFLIRFVAPSFSYAQMFEFSHCITSLITGIAFATISYLVSKKENKIMGICFLLVFLLSPWVIKFAKNMYWVEFTWFVPMLLGLICSINIDKKNIQIICYVLLFVSTLIKNMCGYEYISTVMMGSIAFLLTDLIKSLIEKDSDRSKLLFRTILIIGILEILAFGLAITYHGYLRGNGDILVGIEAIYKEDVLRRAFGGSVSNFDPALAASLEASAFDVIKLYYYFETPVILGLPNFTFIPLCIISLIIAIFDFVRKDYKNLIYYVVFLLATYSWYILGKAHSYEHTHISFVLWSFGYIQIMLCCIVNRILDITKLIIKG